MAEDRGMWRMRIGMVVAMLVLGGVGPGAARPTPTVGVVPSLAGQLLVATPELDDPNFSRTIVYMVQHNDGGALGVVINRVLGSGPLGKLLEGLGIEDGSDSEAEIRVHYGGPVQLGRGVVLHSPDYRKDDPLVVDDLAAFSFSLDALRPAPQPVRARLRGLGAPSAGERDRARLLVHDRTGRGAAVRRRDRDQVAARARPTRLRSLAPFLVRIGRRSISSGDRPTGRPHGRRAARP
jgi:Uncharacterized ACR, COG1678